MLTHLSGKPITNTSRFNFAAAHSSWQDCLQQALQTLDPHYLHQLYQSTSWLPGAENIFNAFSLPVTDVNYVLFGESPYPRVQSANGYAFWDASVTNLWSETGLSKPVNRATSLRNIIKMLLVADGKLNPAHTTQAHIAELNKEHYIQTNNELFGNLLKKGFLLLNATPVLQPEQVRKDARAWRPFLKIVLEFIHEQQPHAAFILLGNIANEINPLLPDSNTKKLYAEHPYNISFINNLNVIDFFKPLQLLARP